MDLQQKAILVALATLAVIGVKDTFQNYLQTKQIEDETTKFLKGTRSNEIRCAIRGDGGENNIPVLFSANLVMGWTTLGVPGNTKKITQATVGITDIATNLQQLEPFGPPSRLNPNPTQHQAIVSSSSNPFSDPSSHVLKILTSQEILKINALGSMRKEVPGVDLKLRTTRRTVEVTNGTFECKTKGDIQKHIDNDMVSDRERLKEYFQAFKDFTESKGSPKITEAILFNYARDPFIIAAITERDRPFLFFHIDRGEYDPRFIVKVVDPKDHSDPNYFNVPHYHDGEEALVKALKGEIPWRDYGGGNYGGLSKHINGVEVLIKSPENTPENTVDLSNSLRGRGR
jgi:hypothetical protein